MTTKLTLKQERFCQVFTSNGGNAAAAYRAAYSAGEMRPTTIYVKACLMLKQDKIRARLQQLMQPEIAKFAVSRHTIAEHLTFTAELARQLGRPQLVYKSMVRLIKICGY